MEKTKAIATALRGWYDVTERGARTQKKIRKTQFIINLYMRCEQNRKMKNNAG